MLFRVIAVSDDRAEAFAEKINPDDLNISYNCMVVDEERKVVLMPHNFFDDIVINPEILRVCAGGQIYRIKLPEGFYDEED